MQAVVPYLSATVSKDKAEKVALDTLSHFFKEMQEKTKVVEEEEEGEDLCNCEFSLAYGTSMCYLICITALFFAGWLACSFLQLTCNYRKSLAEKQQQSLKKLCKQTSKCLAYLACLLLLYLVCLLLGFWH